MLSHDTLLLYKVRAKTNPKPKPEPEPNPNPNLNPNPNPNPNPNAKPKPKPNLYKGVLAVIPHEQLLFVRIRRARHEFIASFSRYIVSA